MYAKGKQTGTIQFAVKGGRDTRAASLAGDFNGWRPVPMRRQKDGTFSVTVRVPPGRYEYKFVLDGDWVHDTDVVDTVMNPHGTFNSVLVVA
jgi:1,4-alpha-glucan branching enzyme